MRFDDARPGRRRGFMLTDIVEVVVATTADEVPDVLARVEAAVDAGHWVGGWVAYEAAPGLDQTLRVASTRGTPFDDLPRAWFAIAGSRTRAQPALDDPRGGRAELGEWQPRMSSARHATAVHAIHRRIAAGDTYQVNLTFQMSADFHGDSQDLYRQLLASQSGGYGAHVDTGRWAVASASPELFFSWADGQVTCRPMKGTTRRGFDRASDRAREASLRASSKDRAENVMIVDMVRNDLARIATTGGVTVPELFTTEKYDTLWQLTSTVTADTRPATTLTDVFTALFPSASITGAPKVATTRIITELEDGPRGVYCGTVGFGGPGTNGPEWDFNVAIRTVTIDRDNATAHYGTGGGITIDSRPDDEHAEAVLKARVLDRQSHSLQLVETTRWDPATGLRHRDAHLARLRRSANHFDIPLDTALVARQLDAVGASDDAALLVRVLVDRGGRVHITTAPAPTSGHLGAGPPPEANAVPAPDAAPGHGSIGVAGGTGPAGTGEVAGEVVLAVDDHPVDPDLVWLHHKTTVRHVYDQARVRHPDADDVILVNRRGHVTETTIGNLVVTLDGRWTTPPLSDGVLAGTERAARLQAGELVERSIHVTDLSRVGRIGRLNSVRGWQHCRLVT